MNFEKLRFEAAKLNMELKLEFPLFYQDVTTTHAWVGMHNWQCYIDSKKRMKLWWDFSGHEVTRVIPDVWRKVNGGWQIVY